MKIFIIGVLAGVLLFLGAKEVGAHTTTVRQAERIVNRPWTAWANQQLRREDERWNGRAYWAVKPRVRCKRNPKTTWGNSFICTGYAKMKKHEAFFFDPSATCRGKTKKVLHVHYPRHGWFVSWRYRRCDRLT